MLSVLLTLMSSPADACSMVFMGDPIGSPSSDQAGPGFAIRPEGAFLSWASLTDMEGQEIELTGDGLGQLFPPENLAPGEYVLATAHEPEGRPLTLLATPSLPDPPTDSPVLTDVVWTQGMVSEWLTASCLEIKHRRHTFEDLSVAIPAGPQPDWAARVSDSSTNESWWAALEEDSRTVTFSQDLEWSGRLNTEDRCLTLEIYDPQGALYSSEDLPCESRAQAPGCSSTGGQGGLALVGTALLGLMLRRRKRA